MTPDLIATVDRMRRSQGFLGIEETLGLAEGGTAILDPFSILISPGVRLGEGNVLHPGVTLFCAPGAELSVGRGNVFHGGTLMAADTGQIRIGDDNQFGEGGFVARANRAGARIAIGTGGRYLGGAAVYGETELGSGSQLLGMISVTDCRLGAGATHRDPDPDRRGGLLKGFGTARNLAVGAGEVIAGEGTFSAGALKRQSFFHPKAKP
ncbi:AraC family transcriptional regulator [Salinarimonas soli]|uniref:AraC family transcriptional regulator n=1 Tax=Salinarimonas soli TaxID=1638099 RepID=A0A5B2V963_9HYPH|nr:AraC family transcriptional regulator [Salinarimonas soli]KAA2236033.1 AraC family transcriptional regulator [Salinarimonas soli]